MFIGFKSKTETKFYHNIHCLYIPPFIMETPKSEGLTSSVGINQDSNKSNLTKTTQSSRTENNSNLVNQIVPNYKKENPQRLSSLISCTPDGPGYIDERDRFNGDTAAEEYQRRQLAILKKNAWIEHQREANIKRDEERVKNYQLMQQDMKRRLDWLQQYSKKANKNKSAYAFEIINLQYHDTDAGSRQLEIDRKAHNRAEMRTKNLVRNAGTRVNYNILTGEPIQKPIYPPLQAGYPGYT